MSMLTLLRRNVKKQKDLRATFIADIKHAIKDSRQIYTIDEQCAKFSFEMNKEEVICLEQLEELITEQQQENEEHNSFVVEQPTERNFECNRCYTRLQNKKELDLHLQEHKKDMELSAFRAKKNTRSMKLKSDVMVRQTPQISDKTRKSLWQCVQCKRKLSSRQNFEAHMLKHANVRPWKCQMCEAKFTSKMTLHQHLRNSHDTGPWECKKCHKSFWYKKQLISHKNICSARKARQSVADAIDTEPQPKRRRLSLFNHRL